MGKKRPPKVPKGSPPPKVPRVAPESQRSSQQETPHFCMYYVDRSGLAIGFDPSGDEAIELLGFMADMAQLTWAEIERMETGGKSRHHKHHDMPVDQLSADAQARVAKKRLDVIFGDDIFRFRLSGTRRLWGFREGRTFHVVWWDPSHAVYRVD